MNRQDVKRKILEAINSLANYDMNAWKQVGPGVQFALIEEIGKLSTEERQKDRDAVIAVCGAVLEPEIDGTVWHANSVTMQTGGVPATPHIVEIPNSQMMMRVKRANLPPCCLRVAPSRHNLAPCDIL
jgi:hypothetical protein